MKLPRENTVKEINSILNAPRIKFVDSPFTDAKNLSVRLANVNLSYSNFSLTKINASKNQ